MQSDAKQGDGIVRICRLTLDNPYEPIVEKVQPLEPILEELRTSLASLEEERVHFNSKVTDISSISEELRDINADIAYCDVHDLATQLEIQRTEQKSVIERLEEARTIYSSKAKQVEEIEADSDRTIYAFPVISYKTEIRSNAATGTRPDGGARVPRYPLPTRPTQRPWWVHDANRPSRSGRREAVTGNRVDKRAGQRPRPRVARPHGWRGFG